MIERNAWRAVLARNETSTTCLIYQTYYLDNRIREYLRQASKIESVIMPYLEVSEQENYITYYVHGAVEFTRCIYCHLDSTKRLLFRCLEFLEFYHKTGLALAFDSGFLYDNVDQELYVLYDLGAEPRYDIAKVIIYLFGEQALPDFQAEIVKCTQHYETALNSPSFAEFRNVSIDYETVCLYDPADAVLAQRKAVFWENRYQAIFYHKDFQNDYETYLHGYAVAYDNVYLIEEFLAVYCAE